VRIQAEDEDEVLRSKLGIEMDMKEMMHKAVLWDI
jgi:hypothetical protein